MSADFGRALPELRVPPPGPASLALAARLAEVESRNVTYRAEDFPVYWTEALGANVRDADGNVYIDLTAGFGVALAGHRPPAVVDAVRAQSERLLHGMGDVHPPEVKVDFLEAFADLLPWPAVRTVLAGGGAEAVEIALKTAQLATGRSGVIAFRGGYHGLTAGALAATARPYFREPFRDTLGECVGWLPYPDARLSDAEVDDVLSNLEGWLSRGLPPDVDTGRRRPVGAIVIEPVQARGGVRVLHERAATRINELGCDFGALVIADEIYTGMGRCGAVLASDRIGLAPALVAAGKALGGGVPIGVCTGPREVMEAWPESPGEALHTGTFLGHPLVAAAGSAMCREISSGLPERAEALGLELRRRLGAALEDLRSAGRVSEVRGLGLLLGFDLLDAEGVPIPGAGFEVAKAGMRRGLILLPAGDEGEVVELSPPAVVTEAQVEFAVEAIAASVRETVGG